MYLTVSLMYLTVWVEITVGCSLKPLQALPGVLLEHP